MKQETIDKYKKEFVKLKKLGFGTNVISRKLGISKSTAKRLRQILNLPISDRYLYKDPFINNDVGKIISCIFGDGCLSLCKSNSNNYYGKISHIVDNKDYMELKKKILKDYAHNIKEYNTQGYKIKMGRTVLLKNTLVLNIKASPYITQIYNVVYKNKQKVINNEILSYCDDMFLALLYFDDGSYVKSRKSYTIALGLLDEDSCKNLSNWIKEKFDIESTIQISMGYRKLYIRRKSNNKFKKLIKKYLVKSMKYKIGEEKQE